MPYVSLYRKYRSQSFDDVVGQDHVTRTIRNAIKAGRIGHAYLFCGSRGTGKTTVARLIAKAVNCEKGPTPDPCNECEACVSITRGSAVDVVELDAASHRKVEDIDALRDGVKYPPMQLRYKVYIIDEAHQLSPTAKDAFLKTLEEPPPHAIFILATTEAHEIPLTIRSRCQQFDFRRGSESEVGERLRYVAKSEGVEIDEDALGLLSESAAGSYRDGLSVLEQVITYSDSRVTAKDVGIVLGTIDDEALQQVAEVVASRDATAAMGLAAKLVEEGKDIRQLLRSITAHFRRLMLISVGATAAGGVAEQAALFPRGRLLRLVELFASADKELRFNDQHRLVLELTLLKALEEPIAAVVDPAIVKSLESAPTARLVSKTPVKPQAPPAPPPVPPAPPPAAEEPEPEPPKAAPEQVRESPAPPPVEEQKEEPPVEETAEETTDGLTIEQVKRVWAKAMMTVQKSLQPVLQEATLLRVEGSTLILGFPSSQGWRSQKMNSGKDNQHVCDVLSQLLGTKVKVRAAVTGDDPVPEAVGEQPAAEPAPSGGVFDQALDMFPGGEVVDTDQNDNPWKE